MMRKTKMKKVLVAMTSLAMMLAMNVTTAFAADMAAPVGASTPWADGTTTVTINVDGNLSSFDYGIVYDKTQVEVAKDADGFQMAEFNSTFNTNYSKNKGISTYEDLGTHVVFGGTVSNDAYTFKGDIASVTFKLKDGVDASAVKLAVVKLSAKFTETYSLPITVTNALAHDGIDVTPTEPVVTPTPEPVVTPTPDPVVSAAPTATAATSAAPVVTAAPATKAPTVTATAATTTTTTAPVATVAAAAKSTSSTSAKTGDTANVVLPIVAICAAAAAVVVASKKKVEE